MVVGDAISPCLHLARNPAKLADTLLKKHEDLMKGENIKEFSRLRILDLRIDRRSGTVWRAGELVELPELSYRLLLALVERAPETVTKDELIAVVWGDVVVSDETLTQRVRLLRQTLGDDGQNPRFIAAVRGRGYRLVAPVRASDSGLSDKRYAERLGVLPIVATALVIVIAGLLWITRQEAPPGGTIDRLGGRYGYFADGMHEELLATLSELRDVQVVSRTTMRQFLGSDADIRDIAARLGATGIIEGSIRVSGDQLRITVQFIDGQTDEHLWAESYDRRLSVENVFAIQEAVATRVADALATEFRQERPERELPTLSTEAYENYLLGRYNTFKLTPAELNTAVDFVQRAVSLDPRFAEAWATLGWAYSFMGSRSGGDEPAKVFPLARDAALRALALDPDLGDAHSVYADILTWYEWEFERAETEFQRTMSIDPINVLGYALFLSIQQRHPEALRKMYERLAVTPDDDYVKTNLGWRLLHAGRFEEAIAAVSEISTHADAASIRGYAMLALGRRNEAATEFENELRRRGRSQLSIANLAIARFLSEQQAEGRRLLEELERSADDAYVSPVTRALVQFAAGNDDHAYELLNDAVTRRARGVIFIGVHPLLIKERADPRLHALLNRIGLPSP